MKLVITYHSGCGHTQKLAHFVAEGARQVPQASVTVLDVARMDEQHWALLHEANALVFGAPTYMGSASAGFKTFMEATSAFWLDLKWADKMAAGFTIGTGQSGDKLSTLTQMVVFACQHAMIWVGQSHLGSLYTQDNLSINECASWTGLMATSSRNKEKLITPGDALTAQIFGRRIAVAALRWKEGSRGS